MRIVNSQTGNKLVISKKEWINIGEKKGWNKDLHKIVNASEMLSQLIEEVGREKTVTFLKSIASSNSNIKVASGKQWLAYIAMMLSLVQGTSADDAKTTLETASPQQRESLINFALDGVEGKVPTGSERTVINLPKKPVDRELVQKKVQQELSGREEVRDDSQMQDKVRKDLSVKDKVQEERDVRKNVRNDLSMKEKVREAPSEEVSDDWQM